MNRRIQTQSSEHTQDETANLQIGNSWQKLPGGLGICKSSVTVKVLVRHKLALLPMTFLIAQGPHSFIQLESQYSMYA